MKENGAFNIRKVWWSQAYRKPVMSWGYRTICRLIVVTMLGVWHLKETSLLRMEAYIIFPDLKWEAKGHSTLFGNEEAVWYWLGKGINQLLAFLSAFFFSFFLFLLKPETRKKRIRSIIRSYLFWVLSSVDTAVRENGSYKPLRRRKGEEKASF